MKASHARRSVRTRIRIGKLPLKIAASVALITGLCLFLAHLLNGPYSAWVVLVIPVASGCTAYVTANRLLLPRIELGRSTLKQVRKHRFDNLEATHLPKGDELNGLIWQVYRTGLAMEKELQELKKIEDYRREFLGNVSHELKTPIFTIQGFAETLLGGALNDEQVNRKFLRKILNNTTRLRNLANDLVEISRIETGELEMVMAPFSLTHLAAEVIDNLERVAKEKNVTLWNAVADNLPLIQGDRARLGQVLVNLVDNAIKYSNEGGTVEVVGRLLPSGQVKVSVVDNGIGIAPQHIPRLTERFYRVDKSRSRTQGGTGLGLAIVKHILGAHNTQMVIESMPGRGSTFGFTLAALRKDATSRNLA